MSAIDREKLVRRHNPQVTAFDPFSSLSVGNGNYTFTADATGLQTFPELYEHDGVPLGHLSNRVWHSYPNPKGYDMANFKRTLYRTFGGREVGYPYMPAGETSEEYQQHRFSPHKPHLGQVGFRLTTADGSLAATDELSDAGQELDLWTGRLSSRFALNGRNTEVTTCCHPQLDLLAVRIRSELIMEERLRIAFRFPYGDWRKSGADWSRMESHVTEWREQGERHAVLVRTMDGDGYALRLEWSDGTLERDVEDPHLFLLTPSSERPSFEFRVHFVGTIEEAEEPLPEAEAAMAASERQMRSFWERGAAVELADSTDPRATELERRIVLSQYLTAIQSSGILPPQESGLTHNSWAGKFHLEMHWWHSVHFALWNRPELLANTFAFYEELLPIARATATEQGYAGARWPKCIGPDGINSPCYIEPFLIWQQPHPIYYAELLYRHRPDRATLERYREIVFETADFMASFAEWDEAGKRYVLGPPVAPAQEVYDHAVTMNPGFELSYWEFGLSLAALWRDRLGLPSEPLWDKVRTGLARLPEADGLYVAAETAADTFRNPLSMTDHPTMLASLGLLPGKLADRETMRRTLRQVMEVWNWNKTWGWDYPMIAMTAARLGEGSLAVDALLKQTQTNTYLPNGHNYQRPPLPVYLPGNGGLLTAVAMMAAGWSGAPNESAPGFPQDGSWTVRSEGLMQML